MDQPAGTLGAPVKKSSVELSSIATIDLAAELLARVSRGESLGGESGYADTFGVLSMELEERGNVFSNRFSRENLSGSWYAVDHHLPDGLRAMKGGTVVELGCGSINPLARLFMMLLVGFERGIGVDLDPIQDPKLVCRGLVRAATYLLLDPYRIMGDRAPVDRVGIAQNLRWFDLAKIAAGDMSGIDTTRLDFWQQSAADLGLPDESTDLVYSFAFLEHVPDVDAVLREMARVIKPGGYALHSIDGTDHRRYVDPNRHPLSFLDQPAELKMVEHSNRLRPMHFVPLFEKHGFEVVKKFVELHVPVDAALRAKFVEPFRSMSQQDLESAVVVVVARRKA